MYFSELILKGRSILRHFSICTCIVSTS